MPHQRLPENPTLLQRFVKGIDESSEHCDGMLSQTNYFYFVTEVGSNETFTCHQSQKQSDWSQFILPMENEINYHESRNHWTLVHKASLTDKAKTIKAIWSFKRKQFPDGSLNNHKARILVHGRMYQWRQKI